MAPKEPVIEMQAVDKIVGERHFTSDFLTAYPAFSGTLSQTDFDLGQQWFRVWKRAMASAQLIVQDSWRDAHRRRRTSVAQAMLEVEGKIANPAPNQLDALDGTIDWDAELPIPTFADFPERYPAC